MLMAIGDYPKKNITIYKLEILSIFLLIPITKDMLYMKEMVGYLTVETTDFYKNKPMDITIFGVIMM